MQIKTFDQFEFGGWESECFLAMARASKNVKGSDWRILDTVSFYKATSSYGCFDQWQEEKIDEANFCKLSEIIESNKDVIRDCAELADISIRNDQMVHLIHSEWNLQDIVWEDCEDWYRAMWCTSS